MTDQKIIVIMTKKQLQAVYPVNDTVRTVSIDGAMTFTYKTENDLSRFVGYIADTFNLSSLDDADMTVILVVCGADNGMANSLNKQLCKVKKNSMIYAEHVLPFILAAQGSIEKNTEKYIKIFDVVYTMKCDETNQIVCEQAESDKNADYNFKGNDFMALFCADVSKIGKDEDLVQRYGELEQNYEVLQQKYNAQQQDYNSLNTAQSKMTSDYENAQKEIKNLKVELESSIEKEKHFKQLSENLAKHIVWWNPENKDYRPSKEEIYKFIEKKVKADSKAPFYWDDVQRDKYVKEHLESSKMQMEEYYGKDMFVYKYEGDLTLYNAQKSYKKAYGFPLHNSDNGFVHKGDIIAKVTFRCSYNGLFEYRDTETFTRTFELRAETDGYVIFLTRYCVDNIGQAPVPVAIIVSDELNTR